MFRQRIRSAGCGLTLSSVCLWLHLLLGSLPAFAEISGGFASGTPGLTFTNLSQLSAMIGGEQTNAGVDLEVLILAASSAEVAVIIAQDQSGVELLELDSCREKILPGDRLRIHSERSLVRRRGIGVEISAVPVVDVDGHHPMQTNSAKMFLPEGRHPFRVEWFNQTRGLGLGLSVQPPGGVMVKVPDRLFWRRSETPGSNLVNGLRVESYEGRWDTLPDFDLLKPVKSGFVPNLDLDYRSTNELVGLRFDGFFEAREPGEYTFELASDDGGMLFVKDVCVPVSRLGTAAISQPTKRIPSEPMAGENERIWAEIEGRVSFVSRDGRGLELELQAHPGSVRVAVADAEEVKAEALLHDFVRVRGVARSVVTPDRRHVLGLLATASARQLSILEHAPGGGQPQTPLVTAAQVHSLRIPEAQQGLPVRIHGVITCLSTPREYWMGVQDNTRGIFVKLSSISNFIPVVGMSCDIIGHSDAGDFAPIVRADRILPLSDGQLPDPARPTWNELINGSMDVQWVEFQGLVTGARSNVMTLLMPEGQLSVMVDGWQEPTLRTYEKAVVRMRGVLFADWETDTRAVRVGSVVLRNASINIDTPAPSDPFNLATKSVRDLFLFDPHATAFQRVKVRGQVILAEPKQIFMMEGSSGMRIKPVEPVEVTLGDAIEAVGYPDISGPAPVLREAIVRQAGKNSLPVPRDLNEEDLRRTGMDSTYVRVEGRLMGTHVEQDARVLEMRSYGHLFLARFRSQAGEDVSYRPGSQLALTGVFIQQRNVGGAGEAGAFEILLHSPSSVVVLSQPSWWTPQRLITVVGLLLVSLSLAVVWISQLRRQVEQRTWQLHREIREREIAERQRALEAERSRIARDLHDDLGSSLTEIGVLASTGLRREEDASAALNPGLPAPENEAHGLFHTIATKTRGLIAALDGIVWAIDPEDNSLQSVADYLSGFAGEYLAHTTLACRFKIPVAFPALVLDGRVRHDLLLTVKEALNNIVRHGVATEVEFKMDVVDEALIIEIADNGKGFDPATARPGSGLKNLASRLTAHRGECQVESTPGRGTSVRIRLPLSAPAKSGETFASES